MVLEGVSSQHTRSERGKGNLLLLLALPVIDEPSCSLFAGFLAGLVKPVHFYFNIKPTHVSKMGEATMRAAACTRRQNTKWMGDGP